MKQVHSRWVAAMFNVNRAPNYMFWFCLYLIFVIMGFLLFLGIFMRCSLPVVLIAAVLRKCRISCSFSDNRLILEDWQITSRCQHLILLFPEWKFWRVESTQSIFVGFFSFLLWLCFFGPFGLHLNLTTVIYNYINL